MRSLVSKFHCALNVIEYDWGAFQPLVFNPQAGPGARPGNESQLTAIRSHRRRGGP
jgi:hypothetical protein